MIETKEKRKEKEEEEDVWFFSYIQLIHSLYPLHTTCRLSKKYCIKQKITVFYEIFTKA